MVLWYCDTGHKHTSLISTPQMTKNGGRHVLNTLFAYEPLCLLTTLYCRPANEKTKKRQKKKHNSNRVFHQQSPPTMPELSSLINSFSEKFCLNTIHVPDSICSSSRHTFVINIIRKSTMLQTNQQNVSCHHILFDFHISAQGNWGMMVVFIQIPGLRLGKIFVLGKDLSIPLNLQ